MWATQARRVAVCQAARSTTGQADWKPAALAVRHPPDTARYANRIVRVMKRRHVAIRARLHMMRLAIRLGSLVPRRWDRARLFVRLTSLRFAISAEWTGSPFDLTVAYAGERYSLRLYDRYEFLLLDQLFLRGEYAIAASNVRTIIDAGANTGLSVIYFAARFPTARIVAFEPDPRNFARLVDNTRDLTNVELRQVGLSGDGNARVLVAASEGWASRLNEIPPGYSGAEIATVRLDDIIPPLGLDLLKLDIEGAEFDVIGHASRLAEVRYIVGELHADLVSTGASIDDFVDDLSLRGYEVKLDQLGSGRAVVRARSRGCAG